MTTTAPSARIRFTVASPMPPLPPVMMATLPLNRCMPSLLVCTGLQGVSAAVEDRRAFFQKAGHTFAVVVGGGQGGIGLAARLRRLEHQARAAELDTAEREGRLVDRASVDRAVETKARRFRDVMLGVPPKLADECARLTDPVAVEAAIEAGIEAALLELSQEGDDAV